MTAQIPNRVLMEFDEFSVVCGKRIRTIEDEGERVEASFKVVSNRTRRELLEGRTFQLYSKYDMERYGIAGSDFNWLVHDSFIFIRNMASFIEKSLPLINAKLMEERLEFELQSVSQELQNLEPSPTTRKRL